MTEELQSKSEVAHHRHDAGFVRTPPIARVAVQFVGGVEDHRWAKMEPRGQVRLNDERLVANGSRFLQAQKRMAQVVEHAQEQNNVESTDSAFADVEHVDIHSFHVKAEGASGVLKMPSVGLPCDVIGGEHSASAASFGLKAVESIPSAYVDDRLTFDAITKVDVGLGSKSLERYATGGDYSVSEVDGVMPGACRIEGHSGRDISDRSARLQGGIQWH